MKTLHINLLHVLQFICIDGDSRSQPLRSMSQKSMSGLQTSAETETDSDSDSSSYSQSGIYVIPQRRNSGTGQVKSVRISNSYSSNAPNTVNLSSAERISTGTLIFSFTPWSLNNTSVGGDNSSHSHVRSSYFREVITSIYSRDFILVNFNIFFYTSYIYNYWRGLYFRVAMLSRIDAKI